MSNVVSIAERKPVKRVRVQVGAIIADFGDVFIQSNFYGDAENAAKDIVGLEGMRYSKIDVLFMNGGEVVTSISFGYEKLMSYMR